MKSPSTHRRERVRCLESIAPEWVDHAMKTLPRSERTELDTVYGDAVYRAILGTETSRATLVLEVDTSHQGAVFVVGPYACVRDLIPHCQHLTVQA